MNLSFRYSQSILLLIGNACFQHNSRYSPIDLSSLSVEDNPIACQSRCANNDICSYFTFWPNEKSCHIYGSTASRTIDVLGAVSGPKTCKKRKP